MPVPMINLCYMIPNLNRIYTVWGHFRWTHRETANIILLLFLASMRDNCINNYFKAFGQLLVNLYGTSAVVSSTSFGFRSQGGNIRISILPHRTNNVSVKDTACHT